MRRKTLVLGIALACGLLGASAFSLGRPTSLSQANGGGPVVVTTVAVGTWPLDVAVNPNTNRIYVANGGSNNVSVIDGASNTVVATVGVGAIPVGVAVNPSTNRIYVGIYVANESSNSVSVIDGASNTVVATVPVGSDPSGVSVNPSTNRIYVANYNSDSVSVIDGASNTVVATVAVGRYPNAVAVNASTNRIYVTNRGSGNVSVIDGASNTVIATVAGMSSPDGVAVNPITNRIYVANSNGNNVSVIDGASNTVAATVPVESYGYPWGVAVNANTNRIYVTNESKGNVSVIDSASNTVVATVGVGYEPLGVVVNPNTNRIYVANFGDGTVTVIDGGPPAWRLPWEYGTKWHYTGGPHHWTGGTLSGLDFASGPNHHVYAVADGTVSFVGQESCVGGPCNAVKIGHQGGWETWYVHLASFAPRLQQGQTVRQGQYVGEEGDSGANGVRHLHLELRKDGAPYSWDGQVIDGWTIHVDCGTGAPAGCTPGEWNGYMENGTEKVIPWSPAGDEQLVGPSTNPSAGQVLGTSVNVMQGAMVDRSATVAPGQSRVYFLTSWVGSTVDASLTAPDGTSIGPSTTDPDVFHSKGGTFEYYEMLTPLAGSWAVHLYGADVPLEGETTDILVAGESASAVGGVAEYPQLEPGPSRSGGSPARDAFALALGVAGGALLLTAGGWYARRRWLH